ncbi:MAG: hypothetical protein WD904_01250 [Dehalococcoidia bacterium]
MKRALPIGLLAACLLLLTACDAFLEFTVVNESGLPLIARVLEESCDESSLNKSDIVAEDRVPADGNLEYFESGAYFGGRCVQVYKENGELVLAEKYEYSALYTVPANPPVIGYVQTTDVLPKQRWLHSQWEWLSDQPVQFLLVWGFAPFVVSGIAYGVVLGVRAMRSRGSHPA